MENDLFGEVPIPEPQPVSVLDALNGTLAATYFLVAFAKREVGRFKDRHQHEIISALMQMTSGSTVNAADVQWWITEGLPRPSEIYIPIQELAQRMDTSQRRIARRAAINIVGSSKSENRLRCLALIDQLFPTTNGPNGIELR